MSYKRRKMLAEGTLISTLRYGIELISSASEKDLKKSTSLQSVAARMVLKRNRKDWSRTGGLKELGWLSIQQLGAEASIYMLRKTQRQLKEYDATQRLHAVVSLQFIFGEI